jgi:cyclopropane fatty-acyl-phospholipid synthase-like methyltransferase
MVSKGSEVMNAEKPFSQACENNKQAILNVLQKEFARVEHVLEVGSGTGQHAVHFAANLPHLIWHCSDVEDYHVGINQWIDEFPNKNIRRPFALKLARDEWHAFSPTVLRNNDSAVFDGIFTANTAHIMLEHEIKALMQSVDEHLPKSGVFCQYGPFKVNGKFTSQSNEDFHHKLLATGRGGYRDIEELSEWAKGLNLRNVIEMPANNLMLIWCKH